MGKRSRANKERQEQRQKESGKQPNEPINENVTRRKFLYVTGATAVGLTVAGALYRHFSHPREDRWDFIKAEPKPDAWFEKFTNNQIVTTFPKLGPEIIIAEGSPVIKEMEGWKPRILREMKKKGLSIDRMYELIAVEQMFGVPTTGDISAHYMDYCKKAKDFLYNNLKGLKQLDISWVVLKEKDDFSKDFENKTFIGDSRCIHYDTKVMDPDNKKNELFRLGRFGRKDGSTTSSKSKDRVNDLEYWFIFFGIGKTAVYAPLSELIHAAVREVGYKHYKQTDYMRSFYANESMAEGISYILSRKLTEELGVPKEVMEIVQKYHQDMNKGVYGYLPSAIRWIEKNGIQNAFDLYIESPEKFMQAIETIKL